MPGFNTLPAVGGGGGQANMTFVASIHMPTYNRSWTQGGTAGYYAMYSTNQENGYVYFVGATTTGGPLNRLLNVTHSFTRIDVIAPVNDMVSLYKAKVKTTAVFNNPFAAFSSFPSVIRSSGNFVLPNNALPLVNVALAGGGGGGGYGEHHRAGGGGGGAGVIKLTAFQAVGTTAITIASGGGQQGQGGQTYFGNVYAFGGGGGANRNENAPSNSNIANGGGASIWGSGNRNGAAGNAQTAATGLGYNGTPAFHGGHSGGSSGSTQHHVRSAGGGGAFEAGSNGGDTGGNGDGGRGHVSDILSGNVSLGAGGSGNSHGAGHGTAGWDRDGITAYSHGGNGGGDGNSRRGDGDPGVVIVRYYIP